MINKGNKSLNQEGFDSLDTIIHTGKYNEVKWGRTKDLPR